MAILFVFVCLYGGMLLRDGELETAGAVAAAINTLGFESVHTSRKSHLSIVIV